MSKVFAKNSKYQFAQSFVMISDFVLLVNRCINPYVDFLIVVSKLLIPKLVYIALVSEPNPLRPLRDLQYGLGEMVFGGCRHLEYMNIWCFNEPN